MINMIKRSVIFIILIYLGMFAREASGIVFVPPVIYIATLSLGVFVMNVFAFFAVWLAVKGLIDRVYFGKPMHELVYLLFSLLGKFVIFIITSSVSMLALDPLNKKEVLIASVLAGILSLIFIFLSDFREYRLISKEKKFIHMGQMIFFSLVVFIVTYVSALRALEVKVLRTNDDGSVIEYRKEESFQDNLSLPKQKSLQAVPQAENDQGMASYYPEQKIAEDSGLVQKKTKALWFYPIKFEPCEIYFGEKLVFTAIPRDNCFYNNNVNSHRIICPVSIFVEDIPANLIRGIGDFVSMRGEGSCTEKYSIIITEDGFNINE